jgi:MFS family permease
LREIVNRGPMTRFQWTAIGICVALNMLDGFDVLVMAFIGPALSAQWKLSGTKLGMLLSAGLFGMTGRSLVVAPWVDRFGRRALIILSLVLISAGMFASALAESVTQLARTRIVTGIGIAGILASITVITSEYSSDRWRSAAVSITATGYPVGTTIGGFTAVILILHFGWRSAFVLGGVISADAARRAHAFA